MPETATGGVLRKKVFLKVSQNSQENTIVNRPYIPPYRPSTLLKRKIQHRRFSVKFAKFLRTAFSQNTSGRLLLQRVAFLVVINLGAVGWSLFYISYGGEA